MKTSLALVFSAFAVMPVCGQTQFLKPKGLPPAHGYSHVVVAKPGRLVFISGQTASGPDGRLVGKGDLKAQTTQVFENLKVALAAAGASFDDVVKIGWYIKDYRPEDLSTLRDVRNRYINSETPPASTLVGVQMLFDPDLLLEVDSIAVVPENRPAQK
ncbi:MAG: RidA family protein [Acidobacteriota bacterium]|nr:RidA family protein [Acidobacteriota bacterium]